MRLEKLSMVQNTLREWKIELSFPQGSVIGLLPIIKERLDRTLQREPLESAVCYLEFEIVRSVYGSAKQKDFLSQKEEEKEAFQTIVARLTEKLGIEKAFFAKPEESYFPEKSWTKSLLEPHDIQLPFSDRPLRMLRVPLKLLRTDQYLQSKSRRWRITEMVGPERLSGDWWQKDIERDYYRVKPSMPAKSIMSCISLPMATWIMRTSRNPLSPWPAIHQKVKMVNLPSRNYGAWK
jgi:hypothetical protein